MAKVFFNSFELSDIRKVVEEVFDNKMSEPIPTLAPTLTLLSRKDTARVLCISLPTLHEWTMTGRIEAFRIGSRVLYKLEDIEKALNQVQSTKREGGKSC